MRGPTTRLLNAAREGGYSVAAFNIVDDLSIRSVLAAAQEARSPVILQVSVRTAKGIGVGMLTTLVDHACQIYPDVPTSLHLDHCPDPDFVREVVAAGWDSALFDASERDYEDAVEATRAVVENAHAHGVEVETEIENILGVEDGVGGDEMNHAYSPEQVVEAAEKTGADILAPQLGTAHGLYSTAPKLLPERAARFAALTDRPLVLHGGTGLSQAEFQSFIDAGISKINISTALKLSYMSSAKEYLDAISGPKDREPLKLFDAIGKSLRSTAAEVFEMFGSTGRIEA